MKCSRSVGRSWYVLLTCLEGYLLNFLQWRPNPSILNAETFVKECRTTHSEDIMGIRGTFHIDRVMELVEQFPIWRTERLPSVRAFQSTYDR